MPTSPEYKKQAALHRQIADALDQAAKAQASLEAIQSGSGASLSTLTPSLHVAGRKMNLQSLSGRDAIAAILAEAGEPLHKREIQKRLAASGVAIAESTLGIYLSRDDRFASRGGGTWGLN